MNKEFKKRPEHKQVSITEGFWKEQLDKIHNITVWDILNKFEHDHEEGIMKNFEWVINGKTGNHIGPPWYDGLIYEVIRGISDLIVISYDKALDEKIEYYTEKISLAQQQDRDGYINTYTTLICPDKRWGENGGSLIWQHELYNIGCLVEAGIHYYKAVGKTGLLKCAVLAANCLCGVIGTEPRKNIVPAHSLAEEAMVKLYRLFEEDSKASEQMVKEYGIKVEHKPYLELAVYWMDHRGVHHNRAAHPLYMGEYAQDHCKIEDQSEAVGHAVRGALLYTGLVAIGMETGEEKYLNAAKRIFENVEQSKLHISGGIGAVHNEERFGYQYDLPNDAYLETCAGAALAFWAGEMHLAFDNSSYMDVFESALYNNVLPGLSEDGVHYFYENPLISDGTLERWSWHGCPCCPPMFLKLMASLQDYIYSYDVDSITINLHIGSKGNIPLKGENVIVEQTACGLPWSGENKVIISVKQPSEFTVKVRIPSWADNLKATIGEEVYNKKEKSGYLYIKRLWEYGDEIQISMELPAMKIEAHPYVSADVGRVALQRGPLLYCLEEVDNAQGTDVILSTEPLRVEEKNICGNCLDGNSFTAVPYYTWNNRGKGTMRVWLNQDGKDGLDVGNEDSALAFAAHRGANHPIKLDEEKWMGKLYQRYYE